MRDGEEIPIEAHEGDTDAAAGIRVHQDGGVPRGGYLEGLICSKHWVEQDCLCILLTVC